MRTFVRSLTSDILQNQRSETTALKRVSVCCAARFVWIIPHRKRLEASPRLLARHPAKGFGRQRPQSRGEGSAGEAVRREAPVSGLRRGRAALTQHPPLIPAGSPGLLRRGREGAGRASCAAHSSPPAASGLAAFSERAPGLGSEGPHRVPSPRASPPLRLLPRK
ncbi:unnamed protein product [Coccothraustes coccothraustes]